MYMLELERAIERDKSGSRDAKTAGATSEALRLLRRAKVMKDELDGLRGQP